MLDETNSLEEIQAEVDRLWKIREQKYREKNSFTIYNVHIKHVNGKREFSMETFENIPGVSCRFENEKAVERAIYESLTPSGALEKMRDVLYERWQKAEKDLSDFQSWELDYRAAEEPNL